MNELGGRFYTEKELQGAGFKSIGKNVKIHNRASIYCPENISLGNNVRIDDFCVLIATGGIEIGNYVHIANYCYLGATLGIQIDDYTSLAPRVSIFSASDDYSGDNFSIPTMPGNFSSGTKGKVIISKYSIIGASSVILPKVLISEGCAVGALSMVKESTIPWSLYCGIPAKKIKNRSRSAMTLEQIHHIEQSLNGEIYAKFKKNGDSFDLVVKNFAIPNLPESEEFILTPSMIAPELAALIRIEDDSLDEILARITEACGTMDFMRIQENEYAGLLQQILIKPATKKAI